VAESILVPATLPPTPLVLADATFLGELAKVEKAVAALSVSDAASAQEAANLLRQLTTVGGSLEKTRADLKKPFLDLGRKIDEVARGVNVRIENSKVALRKRLTAWNAQEEARLAEERRKRDDELMRLQKQREAEEEAERQRAAALAAATPAADALDFDFDGDAPAAAKTETERRIEQLVTTPAPVAQKPAGVRPDQFVTKTANEMLIRSTYCCGWKEDMPLPSVPGLVFWTDTQTASTGRVS
jgi:hypothetical protein